MTRQSLRSTALVCWGCVTKTARPGAALWHPGVWAQACRAGSSQRSVLGPQRLPLNCPHAVFPLHRGPNLCFLYGHRLHGTRAHPQGLSRPHVLENRRVVAKGRGLGEEGRGRSGSTCVSYHTQDGQTMRSYCTAQRTMFNVLWYTIMEKNMEKNVYNTHFAAQKKLTL